jgi:hypothetical protein
MYSIFSSISAKQSPGSSSEGTASISFYVFPKPRFFYRFRNKIDPATENLAQAALQTGEREEIDTRIPIELRGQIDVAVRLGLAASDRAEQGQMSDTRGAQLRDVRAKGLDDHLGSAISGSAHVFRQRI